MLSYPRGPLPNLTVHIRLRNKKLRWKSVFIQNEIDLTYCYIQRSQTSKSMNSQSFPNHRMTTGNLQTYNAGIA